MKVETVPINPYFAQREFKVILEFMFVVILVHFLVAEFKEIRARKARRNSLSLWAGGGMKAKPTWREAIVEHFWTGDEPLSNVIDMVTIGLGFAICAIWSQIIGQMASAEDGLKNLHRPEGVVEYDDTDHDVWSDYHHEVTDVEHMVLEVMHSMVNACYVVGVFALLVLLCLLPS